MPKVQFVKSPTKVKLVGLSSISGNGKDFERVQASLYLTLINPRVRFKTYYRRLSDSQVRNIIEYIIEEDIHQLKHTWVTFVVNCSRLATMDDEMLHFSYTEKSQRYTLTTPRSHIPTGVEGALFENIFKPMVESSFNLYFKFKANGIKLENAREVLTLSTMTSFVSTKSTYDQLLYLASSIRGKKPKEIQDIGNKEYQILQRIAPNIFDENKDVLKKFNPRKTLVSLHYKNAKIQDILTEFEPREVIGDDASSTIPNLVVTPQHPGLIPALAARTTRVADKDFMDLLKEYRQGLLTEKQLRKTLKRVIESGHTSVAEHDYYIIHSTITNSMAHQLVRHRHIWDSYTYLNESGRFFNYIIPRQIIEKKLEKEFSNHMARLKDGFDRLRSNGIEEAYYILPNATLIDIFLTTNAVELLHIIRRRVCKLAQEPIRLRFAIPLWAKLRRNNLAIFANSGPDCLISECKEKWPCNKPYPKIKHT